jgi:hypothetical protein
MTPRMRRMWRRRMRRRGRRAAAGATARTLPRVLDPVALSPWPIAGFLDVGLGRRLRGNAIIAEEATDQRGRRGGGEVGFKTVGEATTGCRLLGLFRKEKGG